MTDRFLDARRRPAAVRPVPRVDAQDAPARPIEDLDADELAALVREHSVASGVDALLGRIGREGRLAGGPEASLEELREIVSAAAAVPGDPDAVTDWETGRVTRVRVDVLDRVPMLVVTQGRARYFCALARGGELLGELARLGRILGADVPADIPSASCGHALYFGAGHRPDEFGGRASAAVEKGTVVLRPLPEGLARGLAPRKPLVFSPEGLPRFLALLAGALKAPAPSA